MLNQKLETNVGWLIMLFIPMILIACGASSQATSLGNTSALATVAASAHSASLVNPPTIHITLTASKDVISLDVDAVDPPTSVVTYTGTHSMGNPTNPADVELGLAPEATNFSITYTVSGNTTYALAVNTDTNEAFTIHYDVDAGETTAVVRAISGTVLATATATGNWELGYPATQGVNMTGLLVIVALGAENGCSPTFKEAADTCSTLCFQQVKEFSYSCIDGNVTTNCVCQSTE